MPRTAEIIAVGSELLTGGVTNTNARFLSELLTAAGVDVLYHTAVGDDENRLEAAVTAAARRAASSAQASSFFCHTHSTSTQAMTLAMHSSIKIASTR